MTRRNRKTRNAVLLTDRVARFAITLGGFGTILTVSTVCLFLVWVVLPLFGSTTLSVHPSQQPSAAFAAAERVVVDEYGCLGWSYGAGTLSVFRPETGQVLRQQDLVDGAAVASAAFAPTDGSAVVGLADGTIRFGEVRFRASFPTSAELENPPAAEIGSRSSSGTGVAERVQGGAVRLVTLDAAFDAAIPLAPGAGAVVSLDYSVSSSGKTLAAVTSDGVLHVKRVVTRRNMLTGQETFTLTGGNVPIDAVAEHGLPDFVALKGLGNGVFLVWKDGLLRRYDARNPGQPTAVETVQLLSGGDHEVTALGFLIGKKTLLVGDSSGALTGWFGIKPQHGASADGVSLVQAWAFPADPRARVTALAASARSRMFAAGYSDGRVGLYQATTRRLLDRQEVSDTAITALTMAPKDDAVVALGDDTVAALSIDLAHPEVSTGVLFSPVWYEGYAKPAHVWQSSSGTDDFEPKLGLMPLIFGTVKATVYSMLFGLPLALLAAIYTSEFLKPQVRARVKPTIELMASLPSVVLGFLAALVIAPFLENVLPQALASVFLVPYGLLLGAHCWQLASSPIRARWAGRRFLMCLATVPISIAAANVVGPIFEATLFGGDIMAWLDGGVASTVGGWFFLLLPVVGLTCAFVAARVVALDHWLRGLLGASAARVALLRFALVSVATVGLSFAVAGALDGAGFDPRGGFLDTYVQRNALIVGFVMGFAVIPIIYTLAEDALSSIPESLRAGSLALGATPWQTAVRVVVPTAMSGLFSAMMVGLGRAVGETMIVLMAAGNTPVMDWNLFNGFRTLSANIAVELPEAVQNSTHYRTLFLAALVLFVLTFVLNTIAELIRLRFRKRAYQL